MTSTTANPPLFSDELVATADERAVLAAFLDLYRETVVRKIRGVSDSDAHRQVVPTLTGLADLVRHLRWLEVEWFEHVLAQRPRSAEGGMWDVSGGAENDTDRTIDEIIASYQAVCRRARELAATRSLDDVVPHERLGQVSLRWIYVHMIEETARHAGHADVVRELIAAGTPD